MVHWQLIDVIIMCTRRSKRDLLHAQHPSTLLILSYSTLTQSGAPGCAIGWSDFSRQFTMVNIVF